MKKKIRDLTEEEFNEWQGKNCYNISCKNCPFFYARCSYFPNHKDLYSDKFLDQEVEIPAKHILDKEEHDYLRAVCKPFKIMSIEKKDYKAYQQIEFFYNKSGKSYSTFSLPPFKKGSMYKGMKPFKQYSIAYLELDKEWKE